MPNQPEHPPEPSPPSTSLDPQEIPVASHPRFPSDQPDAAPTPSRYAIRHSGWEARRARTAHALALAGAPGARLQAFLACGQHAWLMRSNDDPDLYRWVSDLCHDRFCVPCAGARSNLIAQNLRTYLQHTPTRLITLTLRNSPPPLRPQLDRLYLDYRRLRHRKLWKTHVTGAIAFCEVTWNHHTRTWHPHLHVLTIGSYIDQKLLSREWLAVTGDSHIVDIRLVKDPEKVVSYVAKYATKTHAPAVEHSENVYADLIRGMNGRRLLLASGSCTDWKLLDDHADDQWTFVCHVNAIPYRDDIPDDLRAALLADYAAWAAGRTDDTFKAARSPP